MLRSGELRLRQTREDHVVPGRTHERADQYYRGVRVFGADVARQLRGGATESIFGTIYAGIDLDPAPAIDEDRARDAPRRRGSESSWVIATCRRSWSCCRSTPAATR